MKYYKITKRIIEHYFALFCHSFVHFYRKYTNFSQMSDYSITLKISKCGSKNYVL